MIRTVVTVWAVLSIPAGFLLGCCVAARGRTPSEAASMLSVAEQITAGAARARDTAVARGLDPDVAVERFTAAMCAHPSVPKDRWPK